MRELELLKLAIYTKKGNTPCMHDHRASWPMLLDTGTSDRDMGAPQTTFNPEQVGLRIVNLLRVFNVCPYLRYNPLGNQANPY